MVNSTILELKKAYKLIKESQSTLEENIKIHLVRDIFLKSLGYDISLSKCIFEQKKANTYADIVQMVDDNIGLIIETKSYDYIIRDKDIMQLANYIRNRGVEYGILSNGKEYLLINTNIRTEANFNNDMLKNQVVFWFNIFDTKSKKYTHHDFFDLLSIESMFHKKITNYYRDIAQFKALKFPVENQSWYSYKSTLYRFFEYYSKVSKRYSPGVLENINIFDFEKFIDYKKQLSNDKFVSDATINNNYSHISSMLNTLTESEFGCINKNHFDKGRGKSLADIVSGFSSKNYQPIDNKTLSQAVDYYLKKDKGIRDLTIFLLCCCYGMERPRIQKLKWSEVRCKTNNIDFTDIKIEGRILPLNPLLKHCFQQIKKSQENLSLKIDFVFVVPYKGKYSHISTAVINTVFNQLVNISDDEKWLKFSPQFVRISLMKNFMIMDFPLIVLCISPVYQSKTSQTIFQQRK